MGRVMTSSHTTIALSLALIALAAAAPAAAAGGGREVKLQRGLDRVVAAGVPGAVLLVREGDRKLRLVSGHRSLKPKAPMRPQDRFRVGSITKPFVATVVLQLVAEQKLELEDTVERWLPGLVPDGARITVRELLNHTSGLFDFAADPDFVTQAVSDPLRVWTPREIVAIAAAHAPVFPAGAGWSYSDTNYFVLGLVVEAATGRTLAAELHDRIFAPLRLRTTSFPTGPDIAGRHAHGYFVRPFEDVTVGTPSVQWAAGALVSTADDVARFFRALLGGRLLPPDLLELMKTTVAAPQLGRGQAYGLGLQKVPGRCGPLWGHTGASPGYSADALNSKNARRQVVVLVNATGPLSAAGFFGPPRRAARAIARVIHTAYCHERRSAATHRPDRAKLQHALDAVVAGGAPGAVALVRDGRRSLRLVSGYGNVATRRPMRPGDRFRVGSVTKTFVATVILQLAGEGRLALDDTVERWLPGLVPGGASLTVRQLLNHTSGLGDYGDGAFVKGLFDDRRRIWAPAELLTIGAGHGPVFPPGAGLAYSSTGYIALGLIVEAASGHTLSSELRRRIFVPLHLRFTSLDSEARIAGRHAHGYTRYHGGRRPLDISVIGQSFAWAAGAIVSTTHDLARFYRALLRGRLLQPGMLAAMRTTIPAGGQEWGLGLIETPHRCGPSWGHGGETLGYEAETASSPDGTRQAVFAINADQSVLGTRRAQMAISRLQELAYCG